MATTGGNKQQQGGGGRSMYSSPPPPIPPSSTNNDHLVAYNSSPTKNKGSFHREFLLTRPHTNDHRKKCLIVDLDETLVHSSFKVGALFECVLFTASLAKYADPVADLLDKRNIFRSRLFREACVFFEGNYIKDLDRLGRELDKTIIIDNSPASYAFHPENAIPVRTWFDDPHDCELLELIPLLEELAHPDKDIYSVLGTCPPGCQQPNSPKATTIIIVMGTLATLFSHPHPAVCPPTSCSTIITSVSTPSPAANTNTTTASNRRVR